MPEIARSDGSAPIRGVLLAAGAGTRLRPITTRVAKPAVPLLDVPLGAHGLTMMAGRPGALAINVSHLAEGVRAALLPWCPEGSSIEILEETPEPFGTAGTLRALAPRLTGRFATVNGDLLSDLILADLEDTHARLGAPVTIAVTEVGRDADFEGTDGLVTAALDRRLGPAPGRGLRFIGVALFEPEVVGMVPSEGSRGIAESILFPLAARGGLAYHRHDGYALDVGTPARYLQGSLDLLAERVGGPGPPGRRIDVEGGTAYVGLGAETARGRLGPGAIVLQGARVEGEVQRSVVWPGNVVPFGAKLDRAIWFSNQAIPLEAT